MLYRSYDIIFLIVKKSNDTKINLQREFAYRQIPPTGPPGPSARFFGHFARFFLWFIQVVETVFVIFTTFKVCRYTCFVFTNFLAVLTNFFIR